MTMLRGAVTLKNKIIYTHLNITHKYYAGQLNKMYSFVVHFVGISFLILNNISKKTLYTILYNRYVILIVLSDIKLNI